MSARNAQTRFNGSLIFSCLQVSDLIRRNEPLTITNKMGAETRNKRYSTLDNNNKQCTASVYRRSAVLGITEILKVTRELKFY